MRWLVVTQYALEGVGHAVVVESASQKEALDAAWAVFREAEPEAFTCGECDQPFEIDFVVLPFLTRPAMTVLPARYSRLPRCWKEVGLEGSSA